MFACAVFSLGSALQCGASSLVHLTAGRAVGGVGVGALSMLSPLYMAEISPPEVRGSLLALEQLSIVFGCVVGFWAGFYTRNMDGSLSWRIPLAAQLVPGILLGVGTLYLPSSPRLLVLQGRVDRARVSLARLRARARDDPLVEIELLEMQVEALVLQQTQPVGKSAMVNEAQAWARLFSPRFRDRTMIGVMVMFFQQWSGINALLYYGPMLMRSLGLSGKDSNLIVAGGVNIMQFFAVLPAIFFIDKWGRRYLLRTGSAVMCASHLLVAALVYWYEDTWAENSVAAWGAVGCVYVFTAAYGMSFGPVAWVLPSEVFPLSMRSKGVAISTASNWFNNFMIGFITPALMETSPTCTFGLFGVACGAAYFWSTYSVPETANMPLEAIDAAFASMAGHDDAVHRRQAEQEVGLDDFIRHLDRAAGEGVLSPAS